MQPNMNLSNNFGPPHAREYSEWGLSVCGYYCVWFIYFLTSPLGIKLQLVRTVLNIKFTCRLSIILFIPCIVYNEYIIQHMHSVTQGLWHLETPTCFDTEVSYTSHDISGRYLFKSHGIGTDFYIHPPHNIQRTKNWQLWRLVLHILIFKVITL
jgi:hypothetical protein